MSFLEILQVSLCVIAIELISALVFGVITFFLKRKSRKIEANNQADYLKLMENLRKRMLEEMENKENGRK